MFNPGTIFPAPFSLTNALASFTTPFIPKLTLFFNAPPALFKVPLPIPLTDSLNACFDPFNTTFLSTNFNLSSNESPKSVNCFKPPEVLSRVKSLPFLIYLSIPASLSNLLNHFPAFLMTKVPSDIRLILEEMYNFFIWFIYFFPETTPFAIA